MVTVCQKCGDIGFSNALIYCDKCGVYAEHRYCLDKLPETFDEYVTWFCEDCVPRVAKPSTHDKSRSIAFRKSERIRLKTVEVSQSRIRLKKKMRDITRPVAKREVRRRQSTPSLRHHGVKKIKDVTCSVAKTEARRRESSPSLQPYVAHIKVDLTKRAELTGDCSPLDDENKNMPSCSETYEKDQKLEKQRRLVVEDLGNFDREAESVKFKAGNGDPSNISEHNCYGPALPIFEPTWRGGFSLSYENFGTVTGLAAHLSTRACFNSKVFERASLLPALLCLEILPRSDVWPKSFKRSKPTDDNIALYFIPEIDRDEKVFDSLVADMIDQDLAMRAAVENAELLVFTSTQLPLDYWRVREKLYLWGVFRGKQASPSKQLGDLECVVPSNAANDVGTGEEKDLTKTKTWDMRSPLSPLSNSGSYG